MKLLDKSKGHGSGCITQPPSECPVILNCVHWRTASTSLCIDNQQDLHRSSVKQVPRQCQAVVPIVQWIGGAQLHLVINSPPWIWPTPSVRGCCGSCLAIMPCSNSPNLVVLWDHLYGTDKSNYFNSIHVSIFPKWPKLAIFKTTQKC